MKSLALLWFILCFGLLIATALIDHQQLPERVASHFGGDGLPNGWMSKSAFTWFTIVSGLGLSTFIIGIMYSIRFFPARFLNIPNSDYWRAPNNFPIACDFLFVSSLWFGGACLIWHTLLSHLTVVANQTSPPRLDSSKGVVLAILLLVCSLGWIITILIRFFVTGKK